MTTEEIDAMDLRLKHWGVWCRAGARDPALWESDGSHGAGMTRDQVEDAWTVQCMVMRLPLEMRIVCQVQYVSRPQEAESGRGETRVDEANRRLRAAGVHHRLSVDQYRVVRDRAITNLINTTRLTAASSGVSSRPNGFGIVTSILRTKGLAA